MKIKVKKVDYDEFCAIAPQKKKPPLKQSVFLRVLVKLLSLVNLSKMGFKYEKIGMEKVKGEPCLVLMNHSSFVDLEIAAHLLFPNRFSIVCTSDAFVGLHPILRLLGCIETKKFVSDPTLISDMKYALNKNKSSVLMYPEASYSFDGRATALPRRMGLLLKRLDVPVVMITTKGAFSRQPLYNCLKLRKVPVSATMECLLTREQIKEMSADELDAVLDKAFDFDGFLWQQQNKIKIDHPQRADGLERILYKCAHCESEGTMKGQGTKISCSACNKSYTLDEYGYLVADEGETEFSHIPDWFSWEREKVRKEILQGDYSLNTPVKIFAQKNHKAIYDIGEGELSHSFEGFTLKGCQGRLEFTLPAASSYSLYADYFWYEIGDVICIGNKDVLYYCFPNSDISVAKARMATEEIYKILREKKAERRAKSL